MGIFIILKGKLPCMMKPVQVNLNSGKVFRFPIKSKGVLFMNLQAWLTPLLTMGRKKKKSGRGMMWASIISVIISAIALRGLKKGQMEMPKNPLKNIAPKMSNTVDIQKFLTMKDRTVLAEFANEIAPKTNEVNQKVSNNSHLNEDNSI